MKEKDMQVKRLQQSLSGGISGLIVVLFSFVSVYGICVSYGALEMVPHANFIFSSAVFALGFIIAHARIRYLESVLRDKDIEF